jgi:hypothetical protein
MVARATIINHKTFPALVIHEINGRTAHILDRDIVYQNLYPLGLEGHVNLAGFVASDMPYCKPEQVLPATYTRKA